MVTCHHMASQRARNPQLTGMTMYQVVVTKVEQKAEWVAVTFRKAVSRVEELVPGKDREVIREVDPSREEPALTVDK